MSESGDAEMVDRWERAAAGWAVLADDVREFGMPASAWLVDQLRLQPGQVVLELAAGPGDTGFLAAELVLPGGTLISTDVAEPMLEIARARAEQQGITNVSFKALDLQWVDLETATVDAVLCRWGVMFVSDPAAALQEFRRVLRPGGRAAVAVWADPGLNPWATIPTRALIELGHVEPPDPTAPGMFALAGEGRLQGLLEDAGFTDVVVEAVNLERRDDDVGSYIDDTLSLARPFAEAREALSDEQWAGVTARIGELAEPYHDGGELRFPAVTLAAAASA